MVTIGIDQVLSNIVLYKHRCLEISRNYTHILENSTTNSSIKLLLMWQWSPILRYLLTTVQFYLDLLWMSKTPMQENHSVYLPKFLDIKKETAVLWVGATKKELKEIRSGIMFWSSIPKRKRHIKINEQVKISLYNWILQDPQVVQYLIVNDCLKVYMMVTLNHSLFQNCYCKCMYGNFIIAWWSPQRSLELRNQDMQTIISSLGIIHYYKLYHPNSRVFIHGIS